MGENSKWNNWQRTSLQNKQAYEAQYQKSKQPNPKASRRLRHFSKEGIQMANKHMKRCSTSLIIREWTSKLQWGIISYPSEWPSPKKSTNNKCWRRCGEKGALLHCWWECKLKQPLWRTDWRFLEMLGIKLPYNPAISLLGIYPEETIAEEYTCTPMFIATLFTTARTWKHPRCPLTDEWIKKLYTVEYCSAIKRNAFESVLMKWMNPEPIIESEVSQKEKDKYCILMHTYGI